MPRLANRGTTNRAPSSAAAFPSFPDMDPQLAEVDGGKTNAAIQRWNTQMRARLEGNAQQDNGRFLDLQTTATRRDGYLESVWTMQAIAGPVVTGMTLFSSIDPAHNTTVSRITFQADVFQIQTASGNHKEIFSSAADAIKLGDVLTVDLANSKVFIGTGTYANSNTAFFVDDDGFFSLKNRLSFDPTGLGTLTITGTIVATAGAIGGWDINATTISKNNAVLDSAGQLILGTSNDVVYVSATDATYRIWIGNATAGSAAFRVTKAGVMTATAGTFSGLIDIGSGTNHTIINSSGIVFGDATTYSTFYTSGGVPVLQQFDVSSGATTQMATSSGYLAVLNSTRGAFTARLVGDTNGRIFLYSNGSIKWSDGSAVSDLTLYRNSAGNLRTDGNFTADGTITATGGFAGSGSAITTLNASNLSSGTVPTARLGSGSATSGTFLRGDQTWATISAGNVSGLASSATTDTTNAGNISSGTLSLSRLSVTGGSGNKVLRVGAYVPGALGASSNYLPIQDENGVSLNVLCQ